MFKKILQSLSKSQQTKPQEPASPSVLLSGASSSGTGILSKVVPVAGVSATPKTPEELCEITPKMPRDEIAARLKLLYRRYNRGASSLDPKVRAEADGMLEAIVLVREKVFGEI